MFSGIVVAQEKEYKTEGNVVASMLGPIANNFIETYGKFSVIIDMFIYLVIFLGLSQAIFGERFKGKGSKALMTGIGIVLAVSLALFSHQVGFTIADFGPIAGIILVALLAFTMYQAMHIFELPKGFSAALAYVIAYFSLMAAAPSIMSWFNEEVAVVGGILAMAAAFCGIFVMYKVIMMLVGLISKKEGDEDKELEDIKKQIKESETEEDKEGKKEDLKKAEDKAAKAAAKKQAKKKKVVVPKLEEATSTAGELISKLKNISDVVYPKTVKDFMAKRKETEDKDAKKLVKKETKELKDEIKGCRSLAESVKKKIKDLFKEIRDDAIKKSAEDEFTIVIDQISGNLEATANLVNNVFSKVGKEPTDSDKKAFKEIKLSLERSQIDVDRLITGLKNIQQGITAVPKQQTGSKKS